MIVEDFIAFDKEHLSGNKTAEERTALLSEFLRNEPSFDRVKLKVLISALDRRENQNYRRLIETLEQCYFTLVD